MEKRQRLPFYALPPQGDRLPLGPTVSLLLPLFQGCWSIHPSFHNENVNPNLRDSTSGFCGQDTAELAGRGPAFHPKTPHAEGITLPAQARPVTAVSLILISERQPQESGSSERTQGTPTDGVFEGSGSEAP